MRRTRRHADSRISCDGLCLPDRARRSGLLGRHARPGLLGHCLPAPPARAGSPILNEGVRQVRRGLRRIVGTAPRRQARPLGVAEIRRILGAINRETAKGARDASIILLGFASAMRRSELASLTIADVETEPGGLLLAVRRSKTDQDGPDRSWASPTVNTSSPTPSPPSQPGASSAARHRDHCSPACVTGS